MTAILSQFGRNRADIVAGDGVIQTGLIINFVSRIFLQQSVIGDINILLTLDAWRVS